MVKRLSDIVEEVREHFQNTDIRRLMEAERETPAQTLALALVQNLDSAFVAFIALTWDSLILRSKDVAVSFFSDVPGYGWLVGLLLGEYASGFRIFAAICGGAALFLYLVPPPSPRDGDHSFHFFILGIYLFFSAVNTLMLVAVFIPFSAAVHGWLSRKTLFLVATTVVQYLIRRGWAKGVKKRYFLKAHFEEQRTKRSRRGGRKHGGGS